MDVDVSEEGLGQYVMPNISSVIPYEQDGKHFNLDYSMSELERIEACAEIRDVYWETVQNTNAYNYTAMGWFLYIKEEKDNAENSEFHCHVETLTEVDGDADEDDENYVGPYIDITDCNEIYDQDDRKNRRRLNDNNNENEVEGCDGDFIRSSNVDPEDLESACMVGCDYADEYVHKFDAGEPELIVLPMGSILKFDMSDFDGDDYAAVYEFGTLDACNSCVIEEGAEDNNYNRVVANQTETSIILQAPGYRCFAARNPNDFPNNYEGACATRTVVRVDPCMDSVTTDIQFNDTTGNYVPETGFYNLRSILTNCGIGVDVNYTAVYEETISDILSSLPRSYDNSTGVKDISVTVFELGDETDDQILGCLTNDTALSLALCGVPDCVISSEHRTPAPTPEPEEQEESDDNNDESSNTLIYVGIGAAVLVVLGVAAYFFFPSNKGDGHQALKDNGDNYGAA